MKDSKKTETAKVRAGFTLVELVVVIAILGILAGVAYPAYTGYIKKARDAKIESQLSTVVVTVQSAMAAQEETEPLDKIVITLPETIAEGDNKCSLAAYTKAGGDAAITFEPAGILGELGSASVFPDNNTINLKGLKGTSYETAKLELTWTSDSQKFEKSAAED